MPLNGSEVFSLDDYKGGKHKYGWRIESPPSEGARQSKGNDGLYLQADSDVARTEWCFAIECCIERAQLSTTNKLDALAAERFAAAHKVATTKHQFAELLQTLRDSPLMDEAALANVETTIGQIPAYHEKLVTLQADMLQLATRTASMRQRSAHLASQASHSRIAAHSWRVWRAAPTHCTVHALPPRRGLERAG